MKEDYRKLDNQELSRLIQKKTQELIDLRNELSRRMGDTIPPTNFDFTSTITR